MGDEAEDPEPEAPAEPEPQPEDFPWSSSVVILVGDPGDGAVEPLQGSQALAGFAVEGGAVVFGRDDQASTEEGEEEPVESEKGAEPPPPRPITEALAALQGRMAADMAAGQQKKLEAAAEAAAAAAAEGGEEGTEAAEAAAEAEAAPEEGAGAERPATPEETAAPPAPTADVVYYLCGFMDSLEDAEAVLNSELDLGAIVNLRIEKRPDPVVLPTEEELEAELEAMRAFIKAALVAPLTVINAEEEGDEPALDVAGLKAHLLGALAAGKPEPSEEQAAFDAMKLDSAMLAETILMALAPEGEFTSEGTGEDAELQAGTVLAGMLANGEEEPASLAKFRLPPPVPPPEPEPVEAAVTVGAKNFVAEVSEPTTERNSVAWASYAFNLDPDACSTPAPEEGEEPAEPAEVGPEEAAALLATAQDELLAKQVFETVSGLATDMFPKRIEYKAYLESLEIVQVASEPVPPPYATELAYYSRAMDEYEDAGDVGVMHVVCCLVEHVAEASGDTAQTWGGEEPLDAIAAFLSDAAKSTRDVPRPSYVTDKMTMLKLVPGRARVDMPAIAALTEGERDAFQASLYHFMPSLNKFQVERALLREEVRRMIVDSEAQAGSGSAEDLSATWDAELSARTYFLELDPAEMATRYQEAVATMGPDQTVLKSYYARHDQVLIALHTPMPPPQRSVATTDACGISGISNVHEWDAGKRPELAYAVNASKTSLDFSQQSSYLFDCGSVVVRSNGARLDTKAYVSGHVFGTTSGTKTFTASLADGCTLCIKRDDFTNANGGQFMTVTLTSPDGKSVVLNGNGSVSASRKRDTTKYQTDFDRSCAGLSLPDEHNVSVVSKGSVAKHYPDGRIALSYYTGDTSEYDPEDKAWFDMNGGGARQRRQDGVKYDKYRLPEAAGNIPSRKYVDHETNDDVTAREDRVQRNQASDGSSFVKHADGTEMDIGVGFVAVNLPDYALRVKVASADTDVTLEDGGTMQLIWPVLSHFQTGPVDPMNGPGTLDPTKVLHSWNTLDSKSRIVITRPDGTVITVRDGIVSVVPGFPAGSNYVFSINTNAQRPLVEAVDALNNSVTVTHDGSVTSSVAEQPEGTAALHVPSLFLVNPDGSGMEWLKQDATEHMLGTWQAQGVLMRGPAPKEQTSTAFTVSGLGQNDVHLPPLVHGRPQKVIHHPSLTESERIAFTSGVEDFAAWTGAETAAADALIVKETRPQNQIDAEAAVQARAAEEEEDLTMQSDMIAKYLSNPIDKEVIASADEYLRKFDRNHDGILTADEMRQQLDEWGVTQPLEDYIGVDGTAILADKIITKGEWYSFYFPVIEQLIDNGTQLTAARIAQQKAAIAKYAASADMVLSADEYYAQFDLNHDGLLTVIEVRTKLESWGIATLLEDYIKIEGLEGEIPDERVITIGDWYEFYFPVVEQLRPADDPLPLLPSPAAPVTLVPMPEEEIIQQHFLVHPRTIEFGVVIQGCMYRQPLSMTNVGGDNPAKYKVRQPANQAVRLVHGPSAVPKGETAMLEVEFNAAAPGKCQEPIEIVCGDQVFRLSVTADVKLPPKIDFHPYGTGRRLERAPVGGAGKRATDLRNQVAAA